MGLSVYLLSQHSWFIYIYMSRKWQQRIIFTLSKQKIIHEWLSVYTHIEENIYIFLFIYLWHRFTDTMIFIRYEVKSASRNMANAFGKIISVVWIQSLWQLSANDTGGNFFQAAEMGNIAFSRCYELANLNKIKARGDKCVTTNPLPLAEVCICIATKCYLLNDRDRTWGCIRTFGPNSNLSLPCLPS